MTEIVSLILNAVLGGGFIVSIVTMRSTKLKAKAEAKAKELDNVEDAIAIWRNMAEELKKELEASRCNYASVSKEVSSLRREIAKLNNINNQIVKLLDKITPENLDTMIKKIKDIHENG